MNRLLPLAPLALFAILATLALAPARASDTTPRTGDAWIDARLDDISAYGATYRDAFVDELVRYHRAPRELVLELLERPGWSPGDVYLACSLAQQAARPCRSVADAYARDPARGWGGVAREVGIEPGAPAFLALKRGLVASYGRWARPLPAEAEPAPGKPSTKDMAPSPRKDGRAPPGGKAPA